MKETVQSLTSAYLLHSAPLLLLRFIRQQFLASTINFVIESVQPLNLWRAAELVLVGLALVKSGQQTTGRYRNSESGSGQ